MTQEYRNGVAIILRKDDYIFAGTRIGTKESWQLPQGGVDDGEELINAAKRELYEETGILSCEFINSTKTGYKYVFPNDVASSLEKRFGKHSYIGQELHFFLFDFKGDESEINLQTSIQEFTEWKWMTPTFLLNWIVNFKKDAYCKAFSELNII